MEKYEIEVEVEGKIYCGNVVEEKGTLSVSCPSLALPPKSDSSAGNTKVKAELMLRELINQSKGNGW